MAEEFVQEEERAEIPEEAEPAKEPQMKEAGPVLETQTEEAEPAKEPPAKEAEPEKESSKPKNSRIKSVMEYFQFGPDEDFSRDDYILTRVRDEDLMEYLRMDQERERERRAAKELRERRLFRTFQLLMILITVAVIVGFLKDSPLVLVNILYIVGILLAVWIWKNPKDPSKK